MSPCHHHRSEQHTPNDNPTCVSAVSAHGTTFSFTWPPTVSQAPRPELDSFFRPISCPHISFSSVSYLRKWHHHSHLQLLKQASWELAMFPPSSLFLTSNQSPNWGSYPCFPFFCTPHIQSIAKFYQFYLQNISLIFSLLRASTHPPGQVKVIPDLEPCKSLLTGLLACGCLFESYRWTGYSIKEKIRTILLTTLFTVSITLLGIVYAQ